MFEKITYSSTIKNECFQTKMFTKLSFRLFSLLYFSKCADTVDVFATVHGYKIDFQD